MGALVVLYVKALTTGRDRFHRLRQRSEAGEINEKVLIMAIMTIATIAIVGILVTKLTDAAEDINLDTSTP